MKKEAILGIFILIFSISYVSAATNAIAVWDFNDKYPMKGIVHVGVAAYHETGIEKVEFYRDGILHETVYEELINPDAGLQIRNGNNLTWAGESCQYSAGRIGIIKTTFNGC